MLNRCEHEYRSTKDLFVNDDVGECCYKCGKPRIYPEVIRYKVYLKEVSKRMLRSWLHFKDAFDLLDIDAAKEFFISLIQFMLGLIAIVLMPVIFPLYPFIALASLINHRRKLRERVLDYFSIYKEYDNHRRLDD